MSVLLNYKPQKPFTSIHATLQRSYTVLEDGVEVEKRGKKSFNHIGSVKIGKVVISNVQMDMGIFFTQDAMEGNKKVCNVLVLVSDYLFALL